MSFLNKLYGKIVYKEFEMVGWDSEKQDLELVPTKTTRVRYYYAMTIINLKILVFRIKQVFKKG